MGMCLTKNNTRSHINQSTIYKRPGITLSEKDYLFLIGSVLMEASDFDPEHKCGDPVNIEGETDSSCSPRHNSHTKPYYIRIREHITGLRRSTSAPRSSTIHSRDLDTQALLANSDLPSRLPLPYRSKHSNENVATKEQYDHKRQMTFKFHSTRRRVISDRVTVDGDHSGIDNLIFRNNIPSLLSPDQNMCSSQSSFHDPILEDLDLNLPQPPPPPRLLPAWLKLSLQNKQTLHPPNIQGHTDECLTYKSLSPPVSPAKSTPILSRHKSCSLDRERRNIRICPVVQNGIKLSDTHYWLLEQPRSLTKCYQCCTALQKPSSETDVDTYVNFSSKLHEHASAHVNMDSPEHRDMVLRLGQAVPLATEIECRAILIGCNYRYEEAIKRLKLELLYRTGRISPERIRKLLIKCDWDLSLAMEALGDDNAQMTHANEKIKNEPTEKLSSEDVRQFPVSEYHATLSNSVRRPTSLSPLPASSHYSHHLSSDRNN